MKSVRGGRGGESHIKGASQDRRKSKGYSGLDYLTGVKKPEGPGGRVGTHMTTGYQARIRAGKGRQVAKLKSHHGIPHQRIQQFLLCTLFFTCPWPKD